MLQQTNPEHPVDQELVKIMELISSEVEALIKIGYDVTGVDYHPTRMIFRLSNKTKIEVKVSKKK